MRSFLLASALFAIGTFSACGGGSGNGTVTNPVLSRIQVTAASMSLNSGATQPMTATGVYSNGSAQNLTGKVTWSSSDTTIATVDAAGVVTAKRHGSVTITAQLNGVQGSASLTITTTLASISVNATTLAIAPGTSEQFSAIGTYNDGSNQDITASASWSSTNIGVATVSSSTPTQGLAKALSSGSTTIAATSGSITGSATLTVTSATVTAIAVTPTNANIPIGIAQQFTAMGTFSDATIQDITGVSKWSSSATSVASITVSGLATALNIGNTTISAAFGGIAGSAPLAVNAANLASLAITPSNASIAQGTTIQFTATGTFNDGGTRNLTHQVTWSSSDTTVATIGSSSGIATGQPRTSTGVTIISANLGSVSASVNFNVTNATLSSITVLPATKSIPIGAQGGFQATGLFSDSTSQDITSLCKWTSSDTTVATVGSGGGSLLTATGVGAGNATISATLNGISGSATLTVTSATLVSISLAPASAILAPAATLGYNAIGTFSDASQRSINGNVGWSSSDTAVATISGSGTATGQSAGAVTITAQSGSVVGAASLVVEGSPLSSIQISPSTTKLPETIRGAFKATGTFANGDILDITSVVTWTSSSGSVATVSNAIGSQGTATALNPGTTTISALFGTQVGTAALTVTNATLTSVNVTPASVSISAGATQQYTATGSFSDSSTLNLSSQVNWSSSDVSVGIIDSAGLFSSSGVGTATMTATLNGVNGTAVITVY